MSHTPIRVPPSVDSLGNSLAPVIEGVKEFRPVTHEDERGSLCEMYSRAWGFDALDLVHAYLVTVRPGRIKGWACHEHQTDRYFFANGATRLVLFDNRPGSPTYRLVTDRTYSPANRALVSVPPGVFHAVQCVSDSESLFFNIPSESYRHDSPDKLVLPLENDLIPFSFERSDQIPGRG
ncbi:MAG: dTDP-4-dehydrorhamnose 3,5-epimerase [Maricaulis sp.]|jgi:dTDP-4-dehydrorhamnose 3,5-epimerase